MFRIYTRIHINILHSLPQLILTQSFKFLAGEYILGINELQLPGDGARPAWRIPWHSQRRSFRPRPESPTRIPPTVTWA